MIKNMSEQEIIDKIADYTTHYVRRGDELIFKTCPYCGKSDSKFSLNISKQVFSCFHLGTCGARGTLFKFLCDQGIIDPIRKSTVKKYVRPEKDLAITESESFFQWYKKERGINQGVLEKYSVGFKSDNGKKYIVYRFIDGNGQELNRKYRNIHDKKDMRTEKGAEQIYYGGQFLNLENQRLIIVSGEDDVHALVQMGIDNVVSVPFGDKNYSPSMDKVNYKFSEIILMFDADESGQQGAYTFAIKAGLHKCKNVVLPYKDARDCLLNEIDLFKIESEISKARPFTCNEILSVSEIKQAVLESVFSHKYMGVMLPVKEINKILGGVRTGELTTLIAHTGSGKTTFALNFAWWCLQAEMKSLILSFENSVESIALKIIGIKTNEIITSYDETTNKIIIHKTADWISKEIDNLSEYDLHFLNKAVIDNNGYCDIDKIINIIEYGVKFHNTNFVVIDNLHYFLKLSDSNNPVFKIDETLRTITQAACRLDVHILLIVHPPKTIDSRTGKNVTLGLNSAKGASSIQQESFNFMTIDRGEDKENPNRHFSKLKILKNRTYGHTGTVEFHVCDNLNTYTTDSYNPQIETVLI